MTSSSTNKQTVAATRGEEKGTDGALAGYIQHAAHQKEGTKYPPARVLCLANEPWALDLWGRGAGPHASPREGKRETRGRKRVSSCARRWRELPRGEAPMDGLVWSAIWLFVCVWILQSSTCSAAAAAAANIVGLAWCWVFSWAWAGSLSLSLPFFFFFLRLA